MNSIESRFQFIKMFFKKTNNGTLVLNGYAIFDGFQMTFFNHCKIVFVMVVT